MVKLIFKYTGTTQNQVGELSLKIMGNKKQEDDT